MQKIIMILIIAFLLFSCADKPSTSTDTSPVIEKQIQTAISSIEKNKQQNRVIFNVRKNSITHKPIFKNIETRYPLLQPISDILTEGYIKGEFDEKRKDIWITLKGQSCYVVKNYNKNGNLTYIYFIYWDNNVKNEYVLFKYHLTYNNIGNLIRIECRNSLGKLTPFTSYDYCIIDLKYDKDNRIIEEALLNNIYKPAEIDDVHRIKYIYSNKYNNIISRDYYDIDNIMTLRQGFNQENKYVSEYKPDRLEVNENEANKLLDLWLLSQNEKDFELYSSLYSDDFSGTKLSGDYWAQYDKEGWLKDRKSMLAYNFNVSIDGIQFDIDKYHNEIYFCQKWSSPKFTDVGNKVLYIKNVEGKHLITGEEMETSIILRPKQYFQPKIINSTFALKETIWLESESSVFPTEMIILPNNDIKYSFASPMGLTVIYSFDKEKQRWFAKDAHAYQTLENYYKEEFEKIMIDEGNSVESFVTTYDYNNDGTSDTIAAIYSEAVMEAWGRMEEDRNLDCNLYLRIYDGNTNTIILEFVMEENLRDDMNKVNVVGIINTTINNNDYFMVFFKHRYTACCDDYFFRLFRADNLSLEFESQSSNDCSAYCFYDRHYKPIQIDLTGDGNDEFIIYSTGVGSEKIRVVSIN